MDLCPCAQLHCYYGTVGELVMVLSRRCDGGTLVEVLIYQCAASISGVLNPFKCRSVRKKHRSVTGRPKQFSYGPSIVYTDAKNQQSSSLHYPYPYLNFLIPKDDHKSAVINRHFLKRQFRASDNRLIKKILQFTFLRI